MRTLTIICFLLLVSWLLNAQSFEVAIEWKNIPSNQILVGYPAGNESIITDTIEVENGTFTKFTVPDVKRGSVRIRVGEFLQFNLMPDPQGIKARITIDPQENDVEIVKSEVNKAYYRFLDRNAEINRRVGLIAQIFDKFPDDDPFKRDLAKQISNYFDQKKAVGDSIANAYPNTLLATGIKATQLIAPDFNLETGARDEKVRREWFKFYNFADTNLWHSPFAIQHVSSYMGLYNSPNYKSGDLDEIFVIATDRLFEFVYPYPNYRQMAFEFLRSGFEQFGFNNASANLMRCYNPEENCINKTKSSQMLIDQNFGIIKVGEKFPTIKALDINKKKVDPLATEAQYKILLVTKYDCDNCRTELNYLGDFLATYKTTGLEVLALSFDRDPKELTNFAKKINLKAKIYFEPAEFKSKTATDLGIFAVPMVYLLDKNNVVLARRFSLQAIGSEMGFLGIVK